MSLEIIGSGFGRTGTRSLKEALETLGFGPTHHMEEVFGHPEQVPQWQALAAGQDIDVKKAFEGYKSQIDWPGAHVWRELHAAYPKAKVIHSVRPEETWWNSFSKTIGKVLEHHADLPVPPHIAAMMQAFDTLVGNSTFNGNYGDKEKALAAYRLRQTQVEDTIPADQLLVFDVAQGWEPLCAFLGVPVPEVPFPHRNVQDDFWVLVGCDPPE